MKRIFALALALMLLGAALAEADLSHVADASEMTDVIDVVEPGMEPVTADRLNDGTYEVAVDSSSSMFKIVGCTLTVQDGAMTAVLSMKSDSYTYMYPGTAEEAAASDAPVALAVDGESYTFTLPVDALDAGYTCAAFSARKQVWYPRTLLFRSDSLPAEAWKDGETASAEALADGLYTCEVALEGGRATVESPAALTVEGGVATARLVFGTSRIDYVVVDGEKYLPEEGAETAVFTVPVAGFDRKLSITVDSTAITPAVEVAYTMTFDAASLKAE